MACTHPLKAFYTIGNNGKKQLCFYTPEKFNFKSYDDFPDDNKISIPCGQCTNCRLNYSRNWAVRCVLESKLYEHNYFVTLTFDDEHLPISEKSFLDEDSGEYIDGIYSASLDKHHMQKFMKDLRRYFSYHYNVDNIRFFGCGEYGSLNMRPHYHLILFNCPIPDLKFIASNFRGDSYYSSDIISRIWKNGFVTIADCNYDTCSYVARYVLKKNFGKESNKDYGRLGLVPPFTNCSRDPGIGRQFFDDNFSHIYSYDQIVIIGADGVAKKVRPPAYYDRLYDIFCPEDMERVRASRMQSAVNSLKSKLSRTDISADDYLLLLDEVSNNKKNKLLRKL